MNPVSDASFVPLESCSNPVLERFRGRGWEPFSFQVEAWEAFLRGESGLIHAPTGMGKTYAAWLGVLMRWCPRKGEPWKVPDGLKVLWITPLRALAADTTGTLIEAVQGVGGEGGMPWTVELRTGDVSASVKAKQRLRLPTALVTTPESLSLLLSYPDARERFGGLELVVCDEWHELMSSKRGTQVELALARLRAWNPRKGDDPGVQTWGMSATLGNLEQAREVLMGFPPPRPSGETAEVRGEPASTSDDTFASSVAVSRVTHAAPHPGPLPAGERGSERARLIVGESLKRVDIETLIPKDIERFPWAGHLGIKMLGEVLPLIEAANTTLLFTNTRSQAEIWFSEIVRKRTDWIGAVGLHHGSIDKSIREEVEGLLRDGRLKCVVCTSSLDLGVDFSPVDQVIQVGSPKGVARLLQRAGRSGHQPGAVSRVVGVPTNAFELVEFAACRDAAARKEIESRLPLERPLDVLVQHLVTCAMGGGFREAEMYAEVRTSYAYRDLSPQEWRWCLDFVERGGATLTRYPQYARVVPRDGVYGIASEAAARMHRMSIGTITQSTGVIVRYQRGRVLGSVEEGFLAHMKPGDTFYFGGQLLELVRIRDLTAEVKRGTKRSRNIPTWQGGKSPLSTQLAAAVQRKVDEMRRGEYGDAELRAVAPLLELQRAWSAIPSPDELLVETMHTRFGYHLFLYPWQGRLVHEGLGALLAYRLTKEAPRSVTVNGNDYGLELLSDAELDPSDEELRRLLSVDHLLEDLLACLNTSVLARRQFHEIARVAGLIFQGFPGSKRKAAGYLQASSELFFEVFEQFDPENLLLDQARREVLEQQLEVRRMKGALRRMEAMSLLRKRPRNLTPLAFPLWAESIREQHVTSESWEDRVRKMSLMLEAEAAGAPGSPATPGAAVPGADTLEVTDDGDDTSKRRKTRGTRAPKRRVGR